jgi:hypothetical protein
MPLGRPALDCYQSRIDSIKEFMSEGLSHMMKDNILQIECISAASQKFEPDQIHRVISSWMWPLTLMKTFLTLTW